MVVPIFMPKGLPSSGLALIVLVAGCAGEARHPPSSSAPAQEPVQRELWPRFAEVESLPAVNTSAFPTRGHLVKPSYAVVRVSHDARDRYLSLVTDSVLPDGTVLAMFHQSRDGAQRGPVYVMEKKESAWTFLALESDGSIVSENLNVCALCHRGGVADHVFGLPRSLGSPR
jgi:hypothetical protein